MHAPKYFILGILLLWTLKNTFAKLWVLTTHAAPCNANFPTFFSYFWRQLRAKVTIKGVRRREGDMLHWISVLAGLRHLILEYENVKHSYVYKTIAKKTCAPKTRATLAMPNILFGVVDHYVCAYKNVAYNKNFCCVNLRHCVKFMK